MATCNVANAHGGNVPYPRTRNASNVVLTSVCTMVPICNVSQCGSNATELKNERRRGAYFLVTFGVHTFVFVEKFEAGIAVERF